MANAATRWSCAVLKSGCDPTAASSTPNWLRVTGQESGRLSFLPDIARDPRYRLPALIWAVFTVGVLFGAVRLFRRRVSEFAWYVLAALVPTLLLAAWQSMPRHSLVAVPATAAAIQPLRHRWRLPLLGLSILAEIVACESMVGIHLISP